MKLSQENLDFVTSFYFDTLDQDQKNQRGLINMAGAMLTLHGAGGKFVEQAIQHRFKIEEHEGIHDFDGITQDGRLVEMKMETINDTKKLNADGSFGEHRLGTPENKADTWRNKRPYLINMGTCKETGKCLYVLCTDTKKLPENSELFERLSVKTPRTGFNHVSDHPDAYKFLYVNEKLINRNRNSFSKKLLEAIDIHMNSSVSLDDLMK